MTAGVHVLSSPYFGGPYRHPPMAEIFSDRARLARWLRVEVALARCQGRHGVIPAGAARAIAEGAHIDRLDRDALLQERRRTGHSLLPLLGALKEAAGGEAAPFVHFGATTQDIQDSGQSIALAEALGVLDGLSLQLAERLCALAHAHRDSPCMGRTHFRPALPITLGLKVASWLDELDRARARLHESQGRVPTLQLFGAVGSAAAFGVDEAALQQEVAEELGLVAADFPWHNARDRVLEFIWVCSGLVRAAARGAEELIQLSRPELGEIRFAWPPGLRGSSTMPHKRNPEECEQVVVLAGMVQGALSTLMSAPTPLHERDFRGVRMEWALLPEVANYTACALALLIEALERVQVDRPGQQRSLRRYAAELASEPLMFALAQHIGRDRAYELLSETFERAAQGGISVEELLRALPEVQAHLSAAEMDTILDPRRYVGRAQTLVDRVTQRVRGPGGRGSTG